MKIIDIADLPQPVAEAVETIVRTLCAQMVSNGQKRVESSNAEDFDRALDELFAGDSRKLPSVPLTYSRSDIYIDHD